VWDEAARGNGQQRHYQKTYLQYVYTGQVKKEYSNIFIVNIFQLKLTELASANKCGTKRHVAMANSVTSRRPISNTSIRVNN